MQYTLKPKTGHYTTKCFHVCHVSAVSKASEVFYFLKSCLNMPFFRLFFSRSTFVGSDSCLKLAVLVAISLCKRENVFLNLVQQCSYRVNWPIYAYIKLEYNCIVKNNIPVHSTVCVSWKQTNDVIDM